MWKNNERIKLRKIIKKILKENKFTFSLFLFQSMLYPKTRPERSIAHGNGDSIINSLTQIGITPSRPTLGSPQEGHPNRNWNHFKLTQFGSPHIDHLNPSGLSKLTKFGITSSSPKLGSTKLVTPTQVGYKRWPKLGSLKVDQNLDNPMLTQILITLIKPKLGSAQIWPWLTQIGIAPSWPKLRSPQVDPHWDHPKLTQIGITPSFLPPPNWVTQVDPN